MRAIIIAVAILATSSAFAADAPGTQFVQQYVWDIGTFEDIRLQAAAEKNITKNETLASCIRMGTRFQLELDVAAARMKTFNLPGEMKDTPGLIASVYQQRADLYRELGESCAAILSGPKRGADYGAIAANAPKINAKLDYNAKTLFQGSAIIAMALIDQKPDAHGKLSHLVITRREKAELVKTVNSSFGKKLNEKNPTYLVGSVKLIKKFLMTTTHKCADE